MKNLITAKRKLALRKAVRAAIRIGAAMAFKTALRIAFGKILADALDLVIGIISEDDESGPSNGDPIRTAPA